MIALYAVLITFGGYYLSHASYNKKVKGEIEAFIANKQAIESLSGAGQIQIIGDVKELNKWLADLKNKRYKYWLLGLSSENREMVKDLKFIKLRENGNEQINAKRY